MSAKPLVLVTGGAGFIGSHTIDALLERGYSVRILDNLHPKIHPRGRPSYVPSTVDFHRGDVSNPKDLERALEGARFVYHFAAYQDYLPDYSTFVHVNVESTALLYELIAGRRLPVEKVIVASSQAVYGEGRYRCPEDGDVHPGLRDEARLLEGKWDPLCPTCGAPPTWAPTTEETVHPQNPYALSKLAQEQFALTMGRRHRIPTVAMRYSIVQGPRQSFFNAYSGACRIFSLSLYFDRRPPVYEDGRQVRDYVNIHDVVDANVLVLENAEADYQAFNVGGGTTWTVLEFAAIVAKVFGKDIQPSLEGAYRFGDTRHIGSDISKISALGWTPKRTPEDSVREYVAWLRGQNDVEDVLAYAERHMKQLNVVRPVHR